MLKKYLGWSVAATLALTGLAAHAQGAEVNVEWDDPREFRDIRAANGGQARYQENVLEDLGQHFQERAQRHLPAGHTLDVHITDVDLAGHIDFFSGSYSREMRVVRNVDFPRLSFTYEWRDEAGNVLADGEESIADMGFNFSNATTVRRSDPLHFEKRLIDDWFKKLEDQRTL